MSKRSKFRSEFKRGAVEQTRQPCTSCAQFARELGIRDNLLTRWKREAESQGKVAFGGTGTPRDEELVQLKRELAQVKKERAVCETKSIPAGLFGPARGISVLKPAEARKTFSWLIRVNHENAVAELALGRTSKTIFPGTRLSGQHDRFRLIVRCKLINP